MREVVLPEGTPTPQRDRPRAPTVVAVGIALLALLAATFALGQATSPPEDVVADSTGTTEIAPIVPPPTTTTTVDPATFSVRDIATGQNLIWFQAPSLEGRWPIDMLEHEGSVYLFATSIPPRGSTHGGGLEALVSNDGVEWKSLGAVIDSEYAINGVDSTTAGLIATGNHIETDAPQVWTSTDGMEWRISDLPDETAEEELPAFARPTAATRFEDRLIVLGNAQSDLLSLMEERIPEDVAAADIARYGFGVSERDRALRITGPLGLVGYSESLDQLGIDDAMATWLLYTAETEEGLAWSSRDAVNWDSSSFFAFHIENIWHGADGRLFASGLGVFGPMVWASNDGRTWERLGSSSIGGVQVMWRDKLIATTDNHHLLQASDGSNWEYFDTGDLLPAELSWDMGPVAAGEAGLAVVATMRRESDRTTTVVVERDGHIVTMDPLTNTLTVTGGGQDALTVPLWSGEPSDSVQIDFANEVVVFKSPDSAETLLSVDFATLDQAERLMKTAGVDEEDALMFTEDGSTWTVQALSDEIGPDVVVDRMVVLQDRIVLLTHPSAVSVEDASPPQLTVHIGVFQSAGSG